MITSDRCLARYSSSTRTIVSADPSSHGLGAVLLQEQRDGELRAVAFESRDLTPTEQRYAQIEKEALALIWATERFDEYLRGMEFVLQTDHKPLLPHLGQHNFDILSLRVQQFRIRLMRYSYKIEYVPEKNMATADTLSRPPCEENSFEDMLTPEEVSSFVFGAISMLPALEDLLQGIRRLQREDQDCATLFKYCNESWPPKSKLPWSLKPFFAEQGDITVCHDLLLKGPWLVVRCRARAREAVWWPGISSAIVDKVSKCIKCATHRTQPREPMLPSQAPELPWQSVADDLFQIKGVNYLLLADFRSRYPENFDLYSSTSAKAVIERMKSIFARHGIPEVLISDNGPQFSAAEFKDFSLHYGFHHVTTSLRYPQANGEVERIVRTIKGFVENSVDPHLALLNYRNTPGTSGISPAQLLLGRRLRTRLPMDQDQLRSKTHNQTA